MTHHKRRALLASALAIALASALGSGWSAAHAQAWPSKPITLVVPFPPGGGTDAFARPLAATLSRQLSKQVIIDNRGGAGGTVGASIAAKAPADGYTFLIGAVHHTIAPSFYPKLDYDIEKDLANNGSEFSVMKQPEFAAFVGKEIKRWAEVTRVSGAKLD
jgi:tripartite-type tricarboxylate transporter receptor subunit TctC